MPTPAPHSNRLPDLADILAFAGTVVASIVLNWRTRELVWGLWLSSVVIGYALILYGIPMEVRVKAALPHDPAVPGWVRAGGLVLSGFGALFLIAFFTVHFGGFHLVHGVFLNAFFPIGPKEGDGSGFGYLRYLPRTMAFSWPLVLGSVISSRDKFVEATTGHFNPMSVYGNVIRMHLLIFVFAFTSALKLDQRWLYVVVLFFYFFPLRSLKDLLTRR